MIDFFKKNILAVGILIISLGLLIVGMSNKNNTDSFVVPADQVLASLGDFEHLTAYQARNEQGNTDAYVFVDLRSPYDFELSHIENAINIPTAFLLDQENRDVFQQYLKEKRTVVLYGQTELESISPWILLYELGYTNTKVLMGGYACFLEEAKDCPTKYPRYDFAKIASSGGEKEVEIKKTKPPVKKKKVIPVEKKVKAEEEGGC